MITREYIQEPIVEPNLQGLTIITEIETVHQFTSVRRAITGLILHLHQEEARPQGLLPQEVPVVPAEAQEQHLVPEVDLPEVVVVEDYNKIEIQNKPYRQSL